MHKNKNFLKLFLILTIQVVCLFVNAQTTIRGVVIDYKKQPIFAANVFLQSNVSLGTVTDLDGKFELTTKNENDTLIISSIGYRTKKLYIPQLNLKDKIQIILDEDMYLLSELVVRTEDPISKRFSVTKMTGFDVYMTPSSQGDPLKAISILPSSTSVDESANPSLRGSPGGHSIVTLNGVPVYNPVRSGNLNSQGFFSLFNPDIIENQYVYASNPPLTYGNTVAGLVEIQTNKLSLNNQLQLSTSLGNIGGLLTTNFKGNRSSMQLYYNHQFSDLFIGMQKKYYPNIKNFSTDDLGLNFYQKIGRNIEWKSFHYLIHEKYSGYNDDYTYRGQVDTKNGRYFTINSIKYFKNKMSLVLNNGYNHSNSEFKFGNIFSKKINNQSYTSLNMKVYPSDNFELQTGVAFDYSQNIFNDTIPIYYYAQQPNAPKYPSNKTVINKYLETYLYTNWNINEKLSFSSGIRTNIPLEKEQNYLSYQLGFNFNPSKNHSFIIAGGKYHNYSQPSFYTKQYSLLSSNQISFDYRFNYKNAIIKAASYYKKQKGIQSSNTIYNLDFSEVETFGLEFSYEQEFMQYFRFIFNNAFVNQKLYVNDNIYKGSNNLNYYIKSVIEYKNPNLFSVSLSYIGRPGVYYHPIVGTEYINELNLYKPLYGTLYSSQYDNYNRVDLTVNKYITFRKASLAIFMSINNLFDFKNQKKDLYMSNYSEKYYDYYQRRSVYFGGVWYFNL